MWCIECTTPLAKENRNTRCYPHQRSHAHLQEYVETLEVKRVGVERWARGLTDKKGSRMPYVNLMAKLKMIPWDATLEEVQVIDPDGFADLFDQLIAAKLSPYIHSGKKMDAELGSFTREQIGLIDIQYPEVNILDKWATAQDGKTYMRFVSPGEVR